MQRSSGEIFPKGMNFSLLLWSKVSESISSSLKVVSPQTSSYPAFSSALNKGPSSDTLKTLLRICLKATMALALVNGMLGPLLGVWNAQKLAAVGLQVSYRRVTKFYSFATWVKTAIQKIEWKSKNLYSAFDVVWLYKKLEVLSKIVYNLLVHCCKKLESGWKNCTAFLSIIQTIGGCCRPATNQVIIHRAKGLLRAIALWG